MINLECFTIQIKCNIKDTVNTIEDTIKYTRYY